MAAPGVRCGMTGQARPHHLPSDGQAMMEERASVAGAQGLKDAAVDHTEARLTVIRADGSSSPRAARDKGNCLRQGVVLNPDESVPIREADSRTEWLRG